MTKQIQEKDLRRFWAASVCIATANPIGDALKTLLEMQREIARDMGFDAFLDDDLAHLANIAIGRDKGNSGLTKEADPFGAFKEKFLHAYTYGGVPEFEIIES